MFEDGEKPYDIKHLNICCVQDCVPLIDDVRVSLNSHIKVQFSMDM